MSSNKKIEAVTAGTSPNGDPGGTLASGVDTAKSASSSSSTATSTAPEQTKNVDVSKTKIFNSQDFMNFLTTQVDIKDLMVETKDGERFKASFPGSSLTTNEATPSDSGPPKSVFKSLDMLKDLGMVDGDPDPTVLRSTVSLEYFPPNPYPISRSSSAAAAGGTPKGPSASAFASREWAADYQNSHVEVSYTNCFDPNTGEPAANGTSNLPPKKRGAPNGAGGPGDEHWNAMFKRALAPLVDVAVAQRDQGPSNSAPSSSLAPTFSLKKRPGRRKPRKIIPEVKNYCDFTEKDVLFGRGGRSNHHQGNKVYRDIVTEQQDHYRRCDKNEKTKVAQGIVDHMQKVVGARFLEMEKETNRWYLVPNVVARRKVGQALRENNTEEARAAKRAKYQGRYSTIATKKAAEVNAAAAANLASRPTIPPPSAAGPQTQKVQLPTPANLSSEV